jgi:hypothetical protein
MEARGTHEIIAYQPRLVPNRKGYQLKRGSVRLLPIKGGGATVLPIPPV